MKMITLMGVSALALSACTAQVAPPLCDREAIAWDKYGTPEVWEICDAPVSAPVTRERDRDDRRVKTTGVETSDDTGGDEDDDVEPTDTGRDKSDNSDANGKGGNKHDRTDKTKGGTEVAEEKKGV